MFKFLFSVLPFVFCVLTFLMVFCTVPLRTRARAIALMVLLLCAGKTICFEAFGGNPFAPELPAAVIWLWTWGASSLSILFCLALAGLFLRFVLKKLGSCPRLAWLVSLPVLAGALAALGCFNGWRAPDVEEVTLTFENLPASLDGYRILQISDIHASAAARRPRTEKVVELANAQNADLICLTGDYADGEAARQFRNIVPLKDLKAPDGILAITGNHEYYFDTHNWIPKYQSLTNIRFLVDACAFPRPGLAVAGVSDPVAVRFGFPAPDPDLAFASATNGEFRILLQHRPQVDYASLSGRAPAARVDLQLSGHTHGGVAPVLDKLVASFNGGRVRGVYENAAPDGRTIYVSPGAGQWAGFPMRFMNDAKLTLFTLKRATLRE